MKRKAYTLAESARFCQPRTPENWYAALILAVLGAIVGFSIVPEEHVRVLVSALVVRYLAETFGTIPTAGEYVTAIIGNVGTVAAGAALMVVFRNIYNRVKP